VIWTTTPWTLPANLAIAVKPDYEYAIVEYDGVNYILANELVADAEETAILRILVEASNEELARAIPFLVSKKMLTPSMILRAAAIGEMKVVQWSLAHLSGVGLARAHELMIGRGFMGLKSLHSKSGLPQSCYGLLMAACDVMKDAKEEGLPLDPERFSNPLSV